MQKMVNPNQIMCAKGRPTIKGRTRLDPIAATNSVIVAKGISPIRNSKIQIGCPVSFMVGMGRATFIAVFLVHGN